MLQRKLATLVVISFAAGWAAACLVDRPRRAARREVVAASRPATSEEERGVIEVFERLAPSVVFIRNIGLRRDVFTLNIHKVPQGTGSGFVWDERGHIVTNFHVIKDADSISVTLPDQSSWAAGMVGIAADKDLAVLRIDAPREKLHPIPLGRSDNLRVGMTALAIGNPFGLDNTLTKGIISALGREMTAVTGRTITDVIQTDAAINPGNSGGPLISSQGRLIGVNAAILSGTGTSAGIGFAVPVNTVKRVVGQILEHGRVIQPGLGITPLREDLRAAWARRRPELRRGVAIVSVLPSSAAERAGLRGVRYFRDGAIALGDIIVKIGEHDVDDTDDLLNTLERYQVGDVVEVTYRRGGDVRTAKVRLQAVE